MDLTLDCQPMTLDLIAEIAFVIMVMGAAAYILGQEPEPPLYRKSDGMKWRKWYRTVYLQSPWWKKVRAEALRRDSYKCQWCGKPATQVHHKIYTHVCYEYPNHMKDLLSLCADCHRKAHFPMTLGERISRFLRLD